jgi:hypothetical protein
MKGNRSTALGIVSLIGKGATQMSFHFGGTVVRLPSLQNVGSCGQNQKGKGAARTFTLPFSIL